MGVTAEQVKKTLETKLEATEVEVVDTSGGCGAAFEVYITSEQFEGKRLLQRHQLVNAAMAELMPDIHALSIKRSKTPAEVAAN